MWASDRFPRVLRAEALRLAALATPIQYPASATSFIYIRWRGA